MRPGSITINPISWTLTEAEASKEANVGSIRLISAVSYDLTPVKDLASAQVDTARGVVVCDLPPVIVPNPMLGIPIWGGVSLAPLDCIVPLGGVAVKGGAAVQFTLDGQAAERYSPSKRRKG